MTELTARQCEVLLHAANGLTNAKIGAELGITERTVNRHMSAAFDRLGARDRTQAVAIAIAAGVLDIHQIRVPDQQKATA